MRNLIYILILAITFTACKSNSGKQSTGNTDTLKTPVTAAEQQPGALLTEMYIGTLPCADCSGITTELTLQHEAEHGDGTFLLKETYEGKKDSINAFNTNGMWTTLRGSATDKNATVIQITPEGSADDARYFEVLPNGDLLQLDREQKKITSQANYTLKKQ